MPASAGMSVSRWLHETVASFASFAVNIRPFPMRLSLIVIVLLVLAACATQPSRPPVADSSAAWQRRLQRLTGIDTWELRGRLAVRTDEQGGNASFSWVRRGDGSRLTLAAPFGAGSVRVTYDADRAVLTDRSGEVHHGESVQELLGRATGWWLPLQGLEHWVLGLPAPGVPARRELDAWGRLAMLEQEGWHIEFIEYVEQNGYELPRRIFIRRGGDAFGDSLEARFVIERWSVPPPAAPVTP